MRPRLIISILALTLLCGQISPVPAQVPGVGTITIKGVLLIIKGDVYTMQDLSGRFVRFHVNKNTQRERLIVPGEHIEVQLSPDNRAVSIKPAQ